MLSDSLLTDSGFRQRSVITQLFFLIGTGQLVAIFVKIVDTLLLAGTPAVTVPIIDSIFTKVEPGIISHSTGHLRYFGLSVFQRDELTTFIDGDDKLAGIDSLPISRLRGRELRAALDKIEAKAFP